MIAKNRYDTALLRSPGEKGPDTNNNRLDRWDSNHYDRAYDRKIPLDDFLNHSPWNSVAEYAWAKYSEKNNCDLLNILTSVKL